MWKGDERSAIVGPRDQMGEVIDLAAICQDATGGNMFWEHGPSGRGSRDVAQRVTKKSRGVDFQFDSPSDSVEGMSEQEAGLVKRSEEVADHGEGRVCGIFEKNRGSFSSVDTTLDLRDFQNRRQGKIDFDEFPVLFQIRDNISGRTVSHGSAGSVGRFDMETRAKVYGGRIAC